MVRGLFDLLLMSARTQFLLWLLAAAWVTPMIALAADPSTAEILQRLQALEKTQAEQAQALKERDARIAELEARLAEIGDLSSEPSGDVAAPAEVAANQPAVAATEVEQAAPAATYDEPEYFGQFQPGGKGFRIANTPYGDVNFSYYAYARYLNQNGLDETYTDYFGRTKTLDTRNDLQFQKAVLYFKGWVGDPKLRYLAYVWSANTSQGQGAQVVVAGNLTYMFDPAFNLGVGISGLPTTRSTEGNWPNWLRVDNRTIADEYFRGSFTTGLFAFGRVSDTLSYNAMLGNNLSQLGVDAGQLDDTLDTWSGALIWNPQGPYNNGFGDFEQSTDFITRFAAHFTHSTEDRQSQPADDDPENSQIRLSDGTSLFMPGAFGTDGRVNQARYRMAAVDAGLKYNGFSLEGEYYFRWVDQFETEGYVPVSELYDHGFQLQASAMLVPRTWQIYLSGSKIYGEYGDPWDVALGASWFPYQTRQFRLNGEFIYLDNSPVGYSSVPYLVGADGTVFHANAEIRF
jgi:hypothetical protein